MSEVRFPMFYLTPARRLWIKGKPEEAVERPGGLYLERDAPVELLHGFAAGIGSKDYDFQDVKHLPFYTLYSEQYARAQALGCRVWVGNPKELMRHTFRGNEE